MSEEVKIKISQPMFEVGELERFDNNIHSIVEEYSKMMFKEKDQILTQRIIMKQEEEIERLNNRLKTSNDTCNYLRNTIDKAIEYMDRRDLEWGSDEHNKMMDILKGIDKSALLFTDEEQELLEEVERLNNIINKGIEAINVYQNEKTLSVGYQDLKRIRGILRGNEFDLKMFEEYLQELKGEDKE